MKITLTAAYILILLPDSSAMGSTGTKRHANSNSAGLRGGQEVRTTAWHPRTVGAMNGMARHRESTGQLYDSNSVHWATGVAMMQETERTSGTCGDGNVGNGLCPMAGQCCSTYGWCGVGPEYCTGTTVPATSGPLPTPVVTWAPLQVTAPPVLAPVGIAPQAPVGVSPEAPVGGFSEAPVGVFSEAPVGVSPEAPVGGSPEAPVGGSQRPQSVVFQRLLSVFLQRLQSVFLRGSSWWFSEAPVGGFQRLQSVVLQKLQLVVFQRLQSVVLQRLQSVLLQSSVGQRRPSQVVLVAMAWSVMEFAPLHRIAAPPSVGAVLVLNTVQDPQFLP
ncbi:hypothetical protein MHU86_16846 [Fragilaria crotonensis]|nr:hypothetical protein MHU86_16846 [Fragilaria crotonensis]